MTLVLRSFCFYYYCSYVYQVIEFFYQAMKKRLFFAQFFFAPSDFPSPTSCPWVSEDDNSVTTDQQKSTRRELARVKLYRVQSLCSLLPNADTF